MNLMQKKWQSKEVSEVFDDLKTRKDGLTKVEVFERLQKYGFNKLPESKVDNIFVIFLRQFQSPLIYILIIASFIIAITGEATDSLIILFVLVFNAVMGAIQEGRSQNTLLALKKFAETNATVLRDGTEVIISDYNIVPGDVLILNAGDKISGDARVISSNSLEIDEASLTGESIPVHKIAEVLDDSPSSTSDFKNLVFKGTHVVSGSGIAIVVATGLDTAVGKIAKEISMIDTEMPFKANIRQLSGFIIIAVFAISLFLMFAGLASGRSIPEMFAIVVSLSVSIIPEGLPIVVTLVLSTGVWRMSKRNVLVKKIQAIEALGQARLIAVDKTGTITKNELVIQKIYINDNYFDVGGVGYEPRGDIYQNSQVIQYSNYPALTFLGKIATFCASGRAVYDSENKKWQVFGDPTEAALAVFGEKVGYTKSELESENPLILEIPFDYKVKYHTSIHNVDGRNLLIVAGAPEIVLGLSSYKKIDSDEIAISPDDKKDLELIVSDMSRDGLRVLAFAIKNDVPDLIDRKDINELVFVGLVGMKDSLRSEVADAMKKSIAAGVRVVMITGDHRLTARAIANEAGIYKEGDKILTGDDIDRLSDEEISKELKDTSIFARVNPEHKLRIINSYRINGDIVAMTGDGVNDAPSLVAADIGVAMGKMGTEVAKEAADIVILDDNFGSIVSAIEEGRNIYKTIKKVILYLFSTSAGEVLVITASLLLGYPLPILAAQIIWLNLVTDGFLDIALAMEPKESNLLNSNFEKNKQYLIDRLMIKRSILMAVSMMIGTLFLFKDYIADDMTKAWTISLTTLAVFQWFNAWNCRHESKSIFQMNFFSNKFLVLATLIVIFLQILAIYNPTMQGILRTTSLSFYEWILIICVASSILVAEELRKLYYR